MKQSGLPVNDYPIPPAQNTIQADSPSYRLADVPFNKDLAQAAFSKILSIIKGNGIDIKRVTLKNLDAKVFELFGSLHLTLNHDVKQNKSAGQNIVGEPLSSGQLPLKIEKVQQDLSFDTTLCQSIYNDITYGTGRGFGLNEGKIKLPIHKTFTEQDICPQCSGKGQAPCPVCSGRGQAPCSKCRGSAYSPCMMCRGTGRVQTPGGANDLCTYCKGQGKMACDLCQARGYVSCTNCGASGAVQCNNCHATGKIAQVSEVSFYLHPSFQMTVQNLPNGLQKKISHSQNLQNLSASKFFDIRPIAFDETEALIKERLLPPPKSGNFMQIGYRALCPYATLTLSLAGKKDFGIEIAGYKGEIIHSGAFLDILLKKPLSLLKQAVKNTTQTASLLGKAARWKAVRKALALSVRNPPKKAASLLQHAFPFGLSEKMARALCYYAHNAVKSVTRTPRYIALTGFALTLSPILIYIALSQFSPAILGLVPQNIPKPIVSGGVDCFFYLAISMLHIFTIRFAAFISLKQLYTNLGIEKKGKTFPNAGKAAYYVWLINIMIAIAIMAFLLTEKPPYFPF